MKCDLTSSQHYRGLNNRFDKRSKRLRQMGFVYERIVDLNTAVFVKRCDWNPKRTRTVSAGFVQTADNRTFWDTVCGPIN